MLKKGLILVIDDDPDVISAMETSLAAEGYEVVTAMSGEEGIEAFEKGSPDLVLCDMMMEQIDGGMRVAGELRKMNDRIPVYLISSIGDSLAAHADLEKLGFCGVLQKPISAPLLLDTVRKTLARS